MFPQGVYFFVSAFTRLLFLLFSIKKFTFSFTFFTFFKWKHHFGGVRKSCFSVIFDFKKKRKKSTSTKILRRDTMITSDYIWKRTKRMFRKSWPLRGGALMCFRFSLLFLNSTRSMHLVVAWHDSFKTLVFHLEIAFCTYDERCKHSVAIFNENWGSRFIWNHQKTHVILCDYFRNGGRLRKVLGFNIKNEKIIKKIWIFEIILIFFVEKCEFWGFLKKTLHKRTILAHALASGISERVRTRLR